MLLIKRIEICNFACFDRIEIEPSVNPEKPLTVIRAENGSGKTTLLRAIRWGMYGERGLPGEASRFSLHPAEWRPTADGVKTSVAILFETDGSSRNHPEGDSTNTVYELRRTVTTVAKEPGGRDEPDFCREGEKKQLLVRQSDGSWVPDEVGVDSVIEELLPWDLRDFFVMDADEAADFVGGSENKIVNRRAVVDKTSFSVHALLGLDVFKDATKRVRKISEVFGRKATRISRRRDLRQKQDELDRLRTEVLKRRAKLERDSREKDDIGDRLSRARGRLETLVGDLAAHGQLEIRLAENIARRDIVSEQREKAVKRLSGELRAADLLASLAAREIADVGATLQPLYDDGSIPDHHLAFVQGLLEKGICVCGRDLRSQYRNHVQRMVEHAKGKKEGANYLARVLHAAEMLSRHENGDEWDRRCTELEGLIANCDDENANLEQARRDIDAKLDLIEDENLEVTRSEIAMLEEHVARLDRDLVSDELGLEQDDKRIRELDGIIRFEQKRIKETRDLQRYQEVADVLVQILEEAYAQIRDDQVGELSSKMNALFAKMASNVTDDEAGEEDQSHKATIRMIAEVGLRGLEGVPGKYEIFALNNRNRSMPPTEINGASRRILALSFVLGLCEASHTRAPLIADSLLNFTSGSVRTNTLHVTAETASQPILLLTGSDLESQSEADLVACYAGATYTLTGQWQHTAHGGDVVNQTDERQISLLCRCGPRQFCDVCERHGWAGSRGWTERGYGEN